MSTNKAFIYEIKPRGTYNPDEDGSVHQSSPAWVLTFVRWRNRDTLRNTQTPSLEVRGHPLVVENDCLQVSVSDSKGTLTPSMNATLVMTDVNYETEVSPGDFVFVNMLNWEQHARKLADKARALKPINGISDGFKGLFKVQGVRKTITADPSTGVKIVLFRINGFAFTEFNNTIYFNPYLTDPNQPQGNAFVFNTLISDAWSSLVNEKGFHAVQDIIALLIQAFIGTGLHAEPYFNQKGIVNTPNVHFFMPTLVGKFLGLPKPVTAAKDIYLYLFGIQSYGSSKNSSLSQRLNPIIESRPWSGFYYTNIKCDGSTVLKPDYWNQVKTWSILNQYTNSPLNEIYTCFRVSPEGRVMPTVVFRQIPFTNEDFVAGGSGSTGISSTGYNVTKFMNIPRWLIHPAMVFGADLGKDEAARINFVQYFGTSQIGNEGAAIAAENAQGNYVYDKDDVQRSGLRPYIVTTQFEDPSAIDKNYYKSPIWAKIMADAIIGGHLKMNGTIECVGIVEPIAIGDNLQFDNIVYHIEQITHICSISAQSGIKTFRTQISLSHGISINSNSSATKYAEMENTNAYNERVRDDKSNQILPGVAEEQDVVYRRGLRVWPNKQEIKAKNSPFPQPTNVNKRKK